MQNIPRSTQCVQQYPSAALQYFTAEELAAPAEPRARRSRRPPATSCEVCGEVTSDLFGRDGIALCADCAAELEGVR